MIFSLYDHVRVKLGDEAYDFERSSLMFTEVVEIEDVTGLSFGEWQSELGRYSIRAVAGLLHVLRKRAGVPSDFRALNFSAADLECVPLHDDGTEFTVTEVAEDVNRRIEVAREGRPTSAGAAQPPATASTSPSLPATTASGRGNGRSSRGRTSTSSSGTLTPG